MQNGSNKGPDQERWRTRFLVALAIALGGVIADLSVQNFTLLATPQLLAVVIGRHLPKRPFQLLVGLLVVSIFLPASLHSPESALLQRSVGLACLAIVAVALRYDPASGMHGEMEVTGEHSSESVSLLDDPSTMIRLDKNGHDRLSGKSREQRHDPARIIQQLELTGSFDQVQLKLVESQLSAPTGYDIASNHVSSLILGDRVGQYVIDEQLSRGGAGYVFRGRDSRSGDSVAIKILHNSRMSERFRREMRMVQQLAHPNIVTAYEVADFHGLPFIAMELLRGPDLNDHVRNNGPLSWQTSSRYVLQTACALAHAHGRDLIHRDIKPGNIMLSSDDQVKLVDLGLAVMAMPTSGDETKSLDETKDLYIGGTLPYMAPEQARSLAVANTQSDIYGLGATWFYLLTGKPRLPGKTFSQQFENLLTKRKFRTLPNNRIPESFSNIYQRMVAYNPVRRYENCNDLVAELEQALTAAGEAVTHTAINVLVVEDSRTDMLRTLALLRLTNQSLVIHQATTLSEGIEKYNGMHIDLVLLDLTLPDSSGIQTVEAFRRAAPAVPIVVLTGLSEEEVAADCIKAGATSFVSKIALSAHKMERAIFVTLSRHERPD